MTEPNLADLTTNHVGGPVGQLIEPETEAAFIEAILETDATDDPLLVLGSGSNMVVSDDGFPGVVIRDARRGFTSQVDEGTGIVTLNAVAGQNWDELVATAVANGWQGIEALSGIPGTVGATPVQNVGAYGQSVGAVITAVRVWDRLLGEVRTLGAADLDFGYRTSTLKRSMLDEANAGDPRAPWRPSPRYIVLDVTMKLRLDPMSLPVEFEELAQKLGVNIGDQAPSAAVREAVLVLRNGKGMLADDFAGHPAIPVRDGVDHDRWSCGSFFTNPHLTDSEAAALPPDVPRFPIKSTEPDGDKTTETSAAWLIDHAGFHKGFGITGEDSPATLSTKHTLALTNRGTASADDIIALARTIRAGVADTYGITLEPEPVLIGLSL